MTETWRQIRGHHGYEVSDRGRVRSWLRPGGLRIDERDSPRVLKPTPDAFGRLSIVLRDDRGNDRTLSVAKLVLTTFRRRPRDNEIAAYRDGDPGNCDLSNVRWSCRSDVAKNSQRQTTPITRIPAKLKAEIARTVLKEGVSKSEVARRYKLHRATIHKIVTEHAT